MERDPVEVELEVRPVVEDLVTCSGVAVDGRRGVQLVRVAHETEVRGTRVRRLGWRALVGVVVSAAVPEPQRVSELVRDRPPLDELIPESAGSHREAAEGYE